MVDNLWWTALDVVLVGAFVVAWYLTLTMNTRRARRMRRENADTEYVLTWLDEIRDMPDPEPTPSVEVVFHTRACRDRVARTGHPCQGHLGCYTIVTGDPVTGSNYQQVDDGE